MAPTGESIGIAIEDGALIARLLTRYRARSISQVFRDYDTLRRPTIDTIYRDINWRWDKAMKADLGLLGTVFWEYLTVVFLWMMSWKQNDYFATDIAKLELPA